MSASCLLVAAGIRTLGADPAVVRGVALDAGRIVWAGSDLHAAPPCATQVDVGGAWVTPAFVDAHVHGTATGLLATGLDCTGAGSAADLLTRLAEHAAATEGAVIIGAGWDDFGWPERRPPTAAELSAAAPGRVVHLARVDVHSCVVDEATLASLPLEALDGVDRDAIGRPTGFLREQAAETALARVREALSRAQLAEARRRACARAAALGIGAVHEMALPGMYGLDDARAWAAGEWPIDVVVWWAELDVARCTDVGLRPGGDLFLDGSIGSRTAAVGEPYRDGGGTGELFHEDAAVAAFFADATALGLGAGVHAIGDRAIDQAVRGLDHAAGVHGIDAVAACRHRVEHLELPTRAHVDRLGTLGVVASVQPAFDARWGGPEALYASRFGRTVACRTNPLSWCAQAGVPLAFGSDSTVTPLDPWGAVRAAVEHRGGLGIDGTQALHAHTLGGRYAAGQDDVGPLTPGFRADFAVWDRDPFDPDGRPDGDPRCLATVVRGTVVHGDLELGPT